MPAPPTLPVGLARAVRLRCPRCGGRGLFPRWWRMVDTCPTCGLRFAPEDGYWLGAVMVNTGVTEAAFLALLVAGMVLTWPAVPWGRLLVGGVVLTLVLPALLDPFTRTSWVALERHVRRWSETEIPRVPRRVVGRDGRSFGADAPG